MNILMTLIKQHQISLTAKKILEELKPDKFLILCADETNEDFESMPGFVERYNQGHSLEKTYHGKTCYDDMIEIDKELAKAFEPYFETAIQLYARQSNVVDLISYDELSFMVYEALAYWNTVLEKHKIDVFMAFNIPHAGFDYIIYALCKIKGIKTYFMIQTKIPDYSYIIDDIYNQVPELKKLYEEIKEEYKDIDIEDIELPEDFEFQYNKYIKNEEDLTPLSMNVNYLPKGVSSAIERKEEKQTKIALLYEMYKNDGFRKTAYKLFFRISHLFYGGNNTLTEEYYKNWSKYSQKADYSKKFIYFPLHLQPEMTTCPLAGVFMHQELIIHMLSKIVPDDVYIYVKENPKQTAYGRILKFPQKISEYRNVVLLEKDTDTFKLSDNCLATVSTTGTVLWEGMFKRKPGIMFGNFIAEYAPGIFKVSNKLECENAINKILNNDIDITLKDIKLYLLAISKISFKSNNFNRKLIGKNFTNESMIDGATKAFVREISKNIKS